MVDKLSELARKAMDGDTDSAIEYLLLLQNKDYKQPDNLFFDICVNLQRYLYDKDRRYLKKLNALGFYCRKNKAFISAFIKSEEEYGALVKNIVAGDESSIMAVRFLRIRNQEIAPLINLT